MVCLILDKIIVAQVIGMNGHGVLMGNIVAQCPCWHGLDMIKCAIGQHCCPFWHGLDMTWYVNGQRYCPCRHGLDTIRCAIQRHCCPYWHGLEIRCAIGQHCCPCWHGWPWLSVSMPAIVWQAYKSAFSLHRIGWDTHKSSTLNWFHCGFSDLLGLKWYHPLWHDMASD